MPNVSMKSRILFLFIFVSILLASGVLAVSVTFTPDSVPLGGTADINIDVDKFGDELYFYKAGERSVVFTLDLGAHPDCDAGICSGPILLPDYTFLPNEFPDGEYEIYVLVMDDPAFSFDYYARYSITIGDPSRLPEGSIPDNDKCADSDGGIFYGVGGIVFIVSGGQFFGETFDRCADANRLVEGYCTNTGPEFTTVTCEAGCVSTGSAANLDLDAHNSP